MTDTPARTTDAVQQLLDLIGTEPVSRDTEEASPTPSDVPVVAPHRRPDSRRVNDALLSTSAVAGQVGPA